MFSCKISRVSPNDKIVEPSQESPAHVQLSGGDGADPFCVVSPGHPPPGHPPPGHPPPGHLGWVPVLGTHHLGTPHPGTHDPGTHDPGSHHPGTHHLGTWAGRPLGSGYPHLCLPSLWSICLHLRSVRLPLRRDACYLIAFTSRMIPSSLVLLSNPINWVGRIDSIGLIGLIG